MGVELRPFGVACNIACRYCYQNPQREAGNFRQDYQLDKMKAAALKEGRPFTLFGGEPLLLPLADLEELFRWGMERFGQSGIQTNGLLIKSEHITLFKRYNIHVGVSVDGPAELNDLRWHVNLEKTRHNTEIILANIARLCREHQPPGLIITLHRLNATEEKLPRLHAWVRELDALGIRSVRLHLLEVESEFIRRAYSLSDEENARALLSFATLQEELKNVRFDVLGEMERSLLGRDQHASCVWLACDPYTTEAVRGIEGNGQSSNCGRTNKDGVDFIKAEERGFERYLSLYHTPQEDGGCRGCRFFLMCKGQCPGTAVDGDWRNRSEMCGVWKRVFIHLERKLILQNHVPLSIHPVRHRLERHLLEHWARGSNSTLEALSWDAPATAPDGHGATLTSIGDGFRMPSFVRHAFTGSLQRATWAERLDAVRTALNRIGVWAVARRLVPVSVVSVPPKEVFEIHNLAAAQGLHALLLSKSERERGGLLVIGRQEQAASYRRAWEEDDADAMQELTGVPVCCRSANARRREAGLIDPVWQTATAHSGSAEANRDVLCEPCMNILLRPLGIDPLGYMPCSFDCEESQRWGKARLSLGREEDAAEAMTWLEEMLGWPAEWSALHGIAELKTAILKIAYNTDFTPRKVTLRYHGRALAADAARGLSFAYREPLVQLSRAVELLRCE